ncbi:MAG: Na-translocating system protein MpsC family protein [Solirubrobacteraceae bacterium]|jgi:uncharacterized protein YbcI
MAGISDGAIGHGVLAAAVSNGMVGLMHRYTGRGPVRARTTIDENLVVCVLGDTLTKAEQSLVDGGRDKLVLSGRRAIQEVLADDAIALVEELTGRDVVAFMSTNHIDPDLGVEIFVLAPVADA